MKIAAVELTNFKRFASLRLSLRDLNCLVGPNNSGKTTLLQAIALFDFCKQNCLTGKNGKLDIKARTVATEELYVLPVPRPHDLWTDRKTAEGEKQRRIQIALRFETGLTAKATISLSYNRLSLRLDASDPSQEALRALKVFSIAYLPVFSSFLPQEERRTQVAIEDELSRGRVNVVIRNLLLNLRDSGRDQRLTEILRRLFPDLRKLEIVFDEASDRYISVEYQEQGRPKAFDLFSAGSGFQQFLYLFGFILLREPKVVLLDEPDVHLHGSLQRALVEELGKLVKEGTQVLLATHSKDLIERVEPQSIVFLDGEKARSVTVDFDIFDTLDALGSLGNSELPVLQRYRRLLVVENRSDWDILSAFCQKFLDSATWRRLESRLAVCYSEGSPLRGNVPGLRRQVAQSLEIPGNQLLVFAIADRDYYPDRDFLMKKLAGTAEVEWHVWERTEIENYLLVPDAILRISGADPRKPFLWEPILRDQIEATIETSRSEARHRLVKAFLDFSKDRGKSLDPTSLSREADRFLDEHWESNRLGLADAKDFVLPKVKHWCQEQKLGAFSNRALAEEVTAAELPSEVAELAAALAAFGLS